MNRPSLSASLLTIALVAAAPAQAQHHAGDAAPSAQAQHHAGDAAPSAQHSPYAGMQAREIKALSEQQLADLRAGRGMSMALSAELNGYPGPAHVLELATQLELTAAQAARTRDLFAQMQRETAAQGEEVIAAERSLDALFKERKANTENVAGATARAAQAQGRLRAAHLRYHVLMLEVLGPQQVTAYNRLRGY
jgi:Spy/CpxP family protein refolding chaperone